MKRLVALLLVAGCGARATPPDSGVTLRYPVVPSGGGPVLAEVALVSVTFAGDARADAHEAFTRWLAESGWLLERTSEYGVRVVRAGAPVRSGEVLPATLTDAALRPLLPSRAGELYLAWLPDGVALTDRHGNRTCLSNPGTGYHDGVDGTEVPFAVVPACPARFSSVLDVTGSMHLDGARLAVDALTNPSPRNAPAFAVSDGASGWSALGAEVGDFCWGRFVERDGLKVQRVWSNAAVLRGEEPCAPAPAAPAFGLSVEPAGRQSMRVAETVELSVGGWAAGPVEDWQVQVTPWGGDFAIEASLDRATLNAGQTATLTLRVPFAVPPGTSGSVLLRAIGPGDAPLWPVALVVK